MNGKPIPFPEELIREWHYEKNHGLNPSDFTGRSDRQVWWICAVGHSWLAAIKNRGLGTGCPYCAGKKVWVGFNDMRTTHPYLADEWDFDKNGVLRPEDFTGASNKSAWWKCKRGHSWFAMINNRGCGQGCPYCAGVKVLIGFNDLPSTYPHISKEWDYEKNSGLLPEQFTSGSNVKAWWKCEHGHSWKAMIHSRKKHGCPHCYGNILAVGVNDLQTVNPGLASEWDSLKNACTPDSAAANSAHKAWWRCTNGHSWQATIRNRNYGNGCPYCANRYTLKGFNDLLSVDSELCKEWDYEKNAPLLPDEVTLNTSKSVWWRCTKEHSWKATVAHRRKGSGCPVCAGKAVIAGDNDLKTLRPDIADEWDYDKNGDLLPDHVTVQSTPKVWWRCKRGHSYMSRVYNRSNGNGCPYCAGNLPIVGENDLATLYPELLAEWDFEKNGSKKPQDYTCGSNKKAGWKCSRGHRWKASIVSRTVYGCKCPYCKGKFPMRTRLVK